MSVISQCVVCGNRVHRATTGRPPRYCTVLCKRAGRNNRERDDRKFGYIRRHWLVQGEASVKARLADDPDFAEQAIETVEQYLKPPIGQPATAADAEVVDLLRKAERSFAVVSHDTPLSSSADIDEAERSGDWSGMAKAALKDMTWQIASGYQPDLRDLGMDA